MWDQTAVKCLIAYILAKKNDGRNVCCLSPPNIPLQYYRRSTYKSSPREVSHAGQYSTCTQSLLQILLPSTFPEIQLHSSISNETTRIQSKNLQAGLTIQPKAQLLLLNQHLPFLQRDWNNPVISLPSPFQILTSSQFNRPLQFCRNNTSCKYAPCCSSSGDFGTARTFIIYMYHTEERQEKIVRHHINSSFNIWQLRSADCRQKGRL